MSKEKNKLNSDHVLPSTLRVQHSAAILEKHTDQTETSILKKQVFSQELITRLTDRIKKL